jgi:hypothetical protein
MHRSKQRRTVMPHTFKQKTKGGYKATPALERELEARGTAWLEGGRYRATVVRSVRYFEAWTDTQPFVYGRPAESLQAALDNLEEQFADREREMGAKE